MLQEQEEISKKLDRSCIGFQTEYESFKKIPTQNQSIEFQKKYFEIFNHLLKKIQKLKDNNKDIFASNSALTKNFHSVYYNIGCQVMTLGKSLGYYFAYQRDSQAAATYLQLAMNVAKETYRITEIAMDLFTLANKLFPLNIWMAIQETIQSSDERKQTENAQEIKQILQIGKELKPQLQREKTNLVNVINSCITFSDGARTLDNYELAREWLDFSLKIASSNNLYASIFTIYLRLGQSYDTELSRVFALKHNYKGHRKTTIFHFEKNNKIVLRENIDLWNQLKENYLLAMDIAQKMTSFNDKEVQFLIDKWQDITMVHLKFDNITDEFRTVIFLNHKGQEFINALKKCSLSGNFQKIIADTEEAIIKNSKTLSIAFNDIRLALAADKKEQLAIEQRIKKQALLAEKTGQLLIEMEKEIQDLHERYELKLSQTIRTREDPEKKRQHIPKNSQVKKNKKTENTITQKKLTLEEKYCHVIPNYLTAKELFKISSYFQALEQYRLIIETTTDIDLLAKAIIYSEITDCCTALARIAFKQHHYTECANYYKQANDAINSAIDLIQIFLQPSLTDPSQFNKEDVKEIYAGIKISAEDVEKQLNYINDYISMRYTLRKYTRILAINHYKSLNKKWNQKKPIEEISKKALELIECKRAMKFVAELRQDAAVISKRIAKAENYLVATMQPQDLLKQEVGAFAAWLNIADLESVNDQQYMLAATSNLAEKFRLLQDDESAYLYYGHAKTAAQKLNLLTLQVEMADREAVCFDSFVAIKRYNLEITNNVRKDDILEILKEMEKLKETYEQLIKLYEEYSRAISPQGNTTLRNSAEESIKREATKRCLKIREYIEEIAAERFYLESFSETLIMQQHSGFGKNPSGFFAAEETYRENFPWLNEPQTEETIAEITKIAENKLTLN